MPYLIETVAPGAAPGAEFHEALLLAFLLAAIAFLVHGVSERQRTAGARLEDERANFVRVADTLGAHIWTGVRTADDVYRPTYIGPGLTVLAGGGLPPDPEQAVEMFRSRIHPDDRPVFDAAYSNEQMRRHVGGSVEVEYRVIGFDDVTRWIRSRCLVHPLPDGALLLDGIAFDVTTEVALRDEARRIAAEVDAARQQAEAQAAAVRDSEQRFRVMIEHLPSGAIYLQGDELHLNAAAARITGLDAARSLTLDGWFERLHGPQAPQMRTAYDADRAAGFPEPREVPIRRADGVERLVEFAAYGWDEGEVWLLHDVTDRVEAERAREAALGELRRLATTDPLTGLANRRYGTERMTRWLDRDEPAGVLMLDIDHFKRVNDAYGHQAGDAILVARRRAAGGRGAQGRSRHPLGRRGVLRAGAAASSTSRASRPPASACGPPSPRSPSCCPTAPSSPSPSAPAPRWPQTTRPSSRLVEAADRALYLAKRSGRDQVRLASEAAASAPPSEDTDTTRLAQALALATSIREGVPELHCQQVADLAARIAEELGLPAATVRRCRLGGWLHDIGKIAVPDRILAKRGPLDDEEWRRDALPRRDRRSARARACRGWTRCGRRSATTTSAGTARATPTGWRARTSRSRGASWRSRTPTPRSRPTGCTAARPTRSRRSRSCAAARARTSTSASWRR